MSTPDQPVRGHVAGDERDMRAIEALFDGHDTGIAQVNGQWVVYSPELDDAWHTDRLHLMGVSLVARLNGAARAEDFLHRPIRATGRYDGPGNTVSIGTIDAAVEYDIALPLVVDGEQSEPPAPPGPSYLDAAQTNDDLAEALGLLGHSERLTSDDMWKIYEIVREAVGGTNPGTATDRLVANRWLTRDELDSFKAVTNDPAVSGPHARHARHTATSAPPMSLVQAWALVSRLVRNWRQSIAP